MGCGWMSLFGWEVTPGKRSSWAGPSGGSVPPQCGGAPVTGLPQRHGWAPSLASPGCEWAVRKAVRFTVSDTAHAHRRRG